MLHSEVVLETDDIFMGALALVKGGEIRKVWVKGVNGRRLAVFRIVGADMDEVERSYNRGEAVANVLQLRFQLRRLKDKAFDALREEERKDADHHGGRPGAAAPGQPHRRAGR